MNTMEKTSNNATDAKFTFNFEIPNAFEYMIDKMINQIFFKRTGLKAQIKKILYLNMREKESKANKKKLKI